MSSVEASVVPPPTNLLPVSPGPELKHLGFFRTAVIQLYLFVIQFYNHLKEKAGSLKPAIETVEGGVKSAVGPVISRINTDPDEYLKLVDDKVDVALKYAETNTPEPWKTTAVEAYEALSKLPEQAQEAVNEYREKGVVATIKAYFEYLVPIFVSYFHTLWVFILTLPLIPQIFAASQPYVVYIAQHFNHVLAEAKKSEIPFVKSVAGVVPTIPVENLKKNS